MVKADERQPGGPLKSSGNTGWRPWQDAGLTGRWIPDVEVLEKNGKLVVRADLPGMSKDDVKAEVVGNDLVIEGERKAETEKEENGYCTSERSYGAFRRCLTLPAGVDPDKATASFKNGVLEVTMPAPKRQERYGRKLDITAP